MINDLKELQALLKMCRKQGVDEIAVAGVTIKFGEAPRKVVQDDDVETDEPTMDELIYLSAQPGV